MSAPMAQEEYDTKKAEYTAKIADCAAQLVECEAKISTEDSKKDQFKESRATLWKDLATCRERKAALYVDVQRLRLQLSEADRKRMGTRRNVQTARRELKVSYTDAAAMHEAIQGLQVAVKAGNESAAAELALLKQQQPHIQRVDKMIAAELAEEEEAAQLRAKIDAVNKETGTLRKEEQTLIGKIGDLTKKEDVFSKHISDISSKRRKINEAKRAAGAALGALTAAFNRGQRAARRASVSKEAAPAAAQANAPAKQAAPENSKKAPRDPYGAEKLAVASLITYLSGLEQTLATPEKKQIVPNTPQRASRRARNQGFGGKAVVKAVKVEEKTPQSMSKKKKKKSGRNPVVLKLLSYTANMTLLFEKVGVQPPLYASTVKDAIKQLEAKQGYFNARSAQAGGDADDSEKNAEAVERSANRRRSIAEQEAERVRRVDTLDALKAEAEKLQASERVSGTKQAVAAAETARVERVAEEKAAEAESHEARQQAQKQASTWAAVEQKERVDLHQAQVAESRAQEQADREANVAKATELAEGERTRRMSQPEVAAPSATATAAAPEKIRTFMYGPKETRSAYRTWDNDACMGKTAPSISGLKYLQGEAPTEGQVTVVFFWGKFHKAGYKYNPLMTALDVKYPDAKVVGVAVDVEEKDTQTFLDDPKAKYALVFRTNFAVAHDEKRGVLAQYSALNVKGIVCNHTFVIDKEGKIVWHQDQSQIGATVPTFMNSIEVAVESALAGRPVPNVGAKEIVEVADSESDEDGAGGGMGDF